MATTENGDRNTGVLEGTGGRSIGVPRYFTSEGVDPFDAVEWETRTALIPGKDGPSFEQNDVEFPTFWSQTATNIVAQKYFRGKLNTPQRERSVRQMIGRVADTITELGHQGRLLRRQRRGRDLPRRADPPAAAPDGRVQLAGVVQRRLRGEPAVLVPASSSRSRTSMDSILDWITQGGPDLPRRLRLGHQPVQAALLAGAAVQGRLRLRPGLVHARRRRLGGHDQVGRQDPPRGQDGRAERRPPRHRGVHLVQAARGGEGPGAAGGRLRHEPRLARLGVDPVPERQQLGARHRRVHARRARRRGRGI